MNSMDMEQAIKHKHRVEIVFDRDKPNPFGFIVEVIKGPEGHGDQYSVQITEPARCYKVGDVVTMASYELAKAWGTK